MLKLLALGRPASGFVLALCGNVLALEKGK